MNVQLIDMWCCANTQTNVQNSINTNFNKGFVKNMTTKKITRDDN